jgi:sirohydrochlorin ferrochelatase
MPGPHVGVVIVDHGSRRAEANEMLHEVALQFAERTGVAIVEPAHMELAEPTIAQAFGRCVARGAKHVVVCLYFLSPGRHSREDIPAMARAAADAHPGVTWSVTEPLGIDHRIAEVMLERIEASLPQA